MVSLLPKRTHIVRTQSWIGEHGVPEPNVKQFDNSHDRHLMPSKNEFAEFRYLRSSVPYEKELWNGSKQLEIDHYWVMSIYGKWSFSLGLVKRLIPRLKW